MQEFKDVLPNEIPGLLPKRDIDFTIDLVLGAAPLSKTPYMMSTLELLELKNAVTRVVGKEIYQAKCVPVGSTSSVCEKIKMIHSNCVLITYN